MKLKTEYRIKSGFKSMDFGKVTEMLSKTYWSPGIKEPEVREGARNSTLEIGAFDHNGDQIGYARVISDKIRFAYILDVIVDENYRKQGIGQSLVRFLLHHPDLEMVYQWMLITKDAHGVYQKEGFKPLAHPEYWMEIRKPRPDR
jgi:GNAT superfamily N-acetyltransferase